MKATKKSRARMMGALAGIALIASACGGAEVVEEPEGAATEPAEGEETGAESEPAEDTTAAPEDAIPIGSLHPLTGGLAEDGISMDDAIKMAVDDINQAGGIECMDGRNLAVLSADSEGSPEVGQTEAQRMIDDGIVALIGAYQSAVNVNVATLAERNGIPFLVDVGVADNIITEDSQFTFRIQPNATDDGVMGAQIIADIREMTGETIETAVHLHDQTEFGTSINAAFISAAEENGIEVVNSIAYDPFNVSDLTTELAQVDAAGADLLLATGYYPDGVLLARDAMAVEPDVKAVIGIAHGAFDIGDFPEDTGGAGELYLNSNYHFDATSERTQEVRTRYEEQFDRDMRTPAVLAYQQVEVLAAGLEAACSDDPAAIRDGISQVTIEDPLIANDGPIEFDETGENVNAIPILMQVQDGEVVQVHPEEFKEADLIFPGVPWEAEG